LINGRKRHLVTDCLGLLLDVLVTPASFGDRDGARILLPRLRARFSRLHLVWADGGYTGPLVTWALAVLNLVLQVVKRTDDTKGFVVLPRRWVVERTNGWLMRSRRLARDYETRADTAEAMIMWSMTMVMSRRLAGRPRAETAPRHPGTASRAPPTGSPSNARPPPSRPPTPDPPPRRSPCTSRHPPRRPVQSARAFRSC
jgi:transposase